MSWIHIEGTLYGKQGESLAAVVDVSVLQSEIGKLTSELQRLQKADAKDFDAKYCRVIDRYNSDVESQIQRLTDEITERQKKLDEING